MKKLGKLIISVVLLFAMGSSALGTSQILEPGSDNPPPQNPIRNVCVCR